MIQKRLIKHRNEANQQRKVFWRMVWGLSLVFLLALVVYCIEMGQVSFKSPSQKAKFARKIEQTISSTQGSVPSSSQSSVSQLSETRPMTVARQDNDDGYTELGRIMIDKVSIDLIIIKGAGSTETSAYDKLFYACTDKLDQVIGVDNYILASHSSNQPQIGFSRLLTYKDGSLNPDRALDLSQLLLEVGDMMTVYQNSDQAYYTFKITDISGDDTPNHDRVTEKLADIEGRPQLTLYACSKVGAYDDGRLIVQADFVSRST